MFRNSSHAYIAVTTELAERLRKCTPTTLENYFWFHSFREMLFRYNGTLLLCHFIYQIRHQILEVDIKVLLIIVLI